MLEIPCNPKIKAEHLARKAIVYLRQSSDKQVRQNKESQRLQYDVAERMRSLGWKDVEIINCDLGSSAAIASARRDGFERVLSSVALGEVGIVGSREASRLCPSIKRRDSEDSLHCFSSKYFVQSGARGFSESFGSELSSRGHESGFPNRV